MRNLVISTASVAILLTAPPMTGCSVLSPPRPSQGPQPHAANAPQSRTGAARDYSHLLIRPDVVGASGETYTAQPPTLNPHGIPGASTVFVNQAGTRALGNTIFVLASPQAATASLNDAKQGLGKVIEGAVARPAPVGANGTTATGRAPGGGKAVTVVMFTEGPAFVTLKFDAAPADAVLPPQATQVAQRQDSLIKTSPL